LQKGILFDFPSFYYAAQIAFSWGGSPYGVYKFHAASAILGRKVHPYLYPPPSLIAFWPLSFFSIEQAQAAFLVVSHLCYLGSIWLIVTRLTPLPENRRAREITVGFCLIYMLVFDPALTTFAQGQVNMIVLFFICLALTALRREHASWRVALPLSIAILLKTYPVLLLAPVLFRRRFRAAGFTCFFFACFTGVSVLALRKSVWMDWVREILPIGGYADNAIAAAFLWNQSLNAFITRLLVPSEFNQAPLVYPALAKTAVSVCAALLLGATLFLAFLVSQRPRDRPSGDDEISAFLLLTFLIAPLSWDHHLVYILPCATLAISLIVNGAVAGKMVPAVLVAALFTIAWKLPIYDPGLCQGWWVLFISVKFYAVVALWMFYMYRLWRRLRVDELAVAGIAR